MPRQTTPVIIVGAGPVGLTAARLLQQRGIPFIVLEKASTLPEDLRASTFHPPTLDMLDTLGASEPLIAQGLISPTWQVRMHKTGDRALFDLNVLADETAHPYRLQCPQVTLCRILLMQLRQRGADVRLGVAVDRVEQDDAGVRAYATIGDGSEVVVEGSYLIGADGARSRIRGAVATNFKGKTYAETTILATTRFPFHEHLPDLSNVNYVWKDGGTFSLLRLPDLWRCSLYPDGEEMIEQALEPSSIARKLQEIAPSDEPHVVDQIKPYRIHMRIVDRYRDGRLLLAGDAAHLNSPSGGMGMNGGIHDAFELVDTLSEVLDGAPADLLERYTRRRRLVAADEILKQADRNRARMQERDPARRQEMLEDLKAIATDREKARVHLLRTSMITGLRQVATLA